jgi:hypothetical protein
MLEDMTISKNIKRISKVEGRGRFAVSFETEEIKESMQRVWSQAQGEKERTFKIQDEERTLIQQTMTLDGIPIEVEDLVIVEHLKKYVKDPRIVFMTLPGLKIQIDKLIVYHDGPKRPIGKYVCVAPNAPVMVTSASTMPVSCQPLRCVKCLQDGHLVYGCANEGRCTKCTKTGHQARECHKCKICKKFGHTEDRCYFNKTKNNKTPTIPQQNTPTPTKPQPNPNQTTPKVQERPTQENSINEEDKTEETLDKK